MMLDFLNRNSAAIQAFAGLLTVLLALGALFGVKYQVDAADRIQRAQSARDIYREYLNVAINKPEFLNPDYCAIAASPQGAAYEHFVEYVLYTAEQTIASDPAWQDSFAETLKPHATYLCAIEDDDAYSEAVTQMLTSFKAKQCAEVVTCKN